MASGGQIDQGQPLVGPSEGNPDPEHMYQGHGQPPMKARLEQARNFLADEDYFRCLGFTKKLLEIEGYTECLKKSEEDYTTDDHNRLVKMIAIHRGWIKKATEIPALDFTWIWTHMRPSSRLEPWDNMVKFRRIYNDSSLALPRPQVGMKEALITIPLPRHERVDDKDPFLFTKRLSDFRERQDILASAFQAMESSLFAGNTSYVRAPANRNGPLLPMDKALVENGIAQQLHRLLAVLGRLVDAVERAPRPFLRTVIMQIQKGLCCQATTAEEAEEMDIQMRSAVAKDVGVLIRRWLDTQRSENGTVGRRVPALDGGMTLDLGDEVLVGNADIDLILILAEESWTSERETLAFDDRTAVQNPTQDAQVSYSDLGAFSQRLESLFNSDLFPQADSIAGFEDVILRINRLAQYETKQQNMGPSVISLAGQGRVFDKDEAISCLERMSAVGRIRWIPRNRAMQKPIPNCHPEHRFLPLSYHDPLTAIQLNGKGDVGLPVQQDVSVFLDIGFRLGQEMLRLLGRLAGNAHAAGEQAPAADKFAQFLRLHDSGDAKERTLSGIFPDPVNTEQSEDETAVVLQLNIIREMNQNGDPRTPDFEDLWAFSNSMPTSKVFFSLDRWPKPLQIDGRMTQSQDAEPEISKIPHEIAPSKSRVMVRDRLEAKAVELLARDVPRKEMYYKGDASFPFGETAIQRAWLSQQIDEDLQNVSEFARLYKPSDGKPRLTANAPYDPFKLPKLHNKWSEDEPWIKPQKVPKHLSSNRGPTTNDGLDQKAVELPEDDTPELLGSLRTGEKRLHEDDDRQDTDDVHELARKMRRGYS
ncbi:MAG: hypothetical protein M1818_002931 [Claussenomyces sp. TS43310]|nr:MAG: hypothetical protein M1818_002931 [Claussenomyces sp. TS43310]